MALENHDLRFPTLVHHALSKATQKLEKSLGHAFGSDQHDLDFPRFNVLYYLPRLDAYFHILPFWPLQRGTRLPGAASPFYQELAKTSGNYLTDGEVSAILAWADRSPCVWDAIQQLVTLGLAQHLGTPSDPYSLLRTLVAGFNGNQEGLVEKLQDLGLLQPVVHVMLSVLPQFEGAATAILRRTSPPDEWISSEEKLKRLSELRTLFDRNDGKLPFQTRLFGLLSLIESLQWQEGASFVLIGDTCKFLGIAGGIPSGRLLL